VSFWTFAGAALASFTAVGIAFGAYPWQKNKDRSLQINSEQRALYLDVLAKIIAVQRRLEEVSPEGFEKLQATLSDWAKSLRELEDAVLILAACGDQDVVEAAFDCLETLREGIPLMAVKGRADLGEGPELIGAEDLKTFFHDTRKDILQKHDPKVSKLVNVMRRNVFGLDADIDFQSRVTRG